MIHKIRNSLIPLFEDTSTEKTAPIKILPIVLWAAVCGIIGDVMTFLIPTSHPLVVSLVVTLAVMALTFRFVLKKVVSASQNEADSR